MALKMKEKKQKILFVINTMGRAGAERSLIALLNVMDKKKFDIYVFSIILRGEFFAYIPDGVKILNEDFSCDSVMNKAGKLNSFILVTKALLKDFYWFRSMPYLFKSAFSQIKNGKFTFSKLFYDALSKYAPRFDIEFDLAVAFIEGGATYYVSDYVKAKKKAAFVHLDHAKSGYVRDLDYRHYVKYEKIFCVSQPLIQSLVKEYPEFEGKIEILHNLVSEDFIISKANNGVGFLDDYEGVRLVTVGRLHPQKAYDVAIRTLARLISEHPGLDVRWYAIGEGEERKNLEKLIEKLNLQGKFVLLGGKLNPYPFVKECDIYLHCTVHEGWSIAIAEARILQKIIIASDTTGIETQLPPGNAIVVKLNEEEISDAIYKVISDEGLREEMYGRLSEEWVRPDDTDKLYKLLEG